jgi:hypothetical protein
MGDDDNDDFREAFLRANAREDFIVAQLADMLRDLMRAVSSDDVSGKAWSAGEQMTFVCKLIARSETPLSWHRLMSDAVRSITDNIPEDPDDQKLISAAKRGMKYLVECSATDNAARGRASKRRTEFEDAIRWSQEARGRRR